MFTNEHSGDIVIQPAAGTFTIRPAAKATLMLPSSRRRSSSFFLIIAAFIFSAAAFPIRTAATTFSAEDIIAGTNIERTSAGLPALTTNAQLTQAAAAKAQDMLTHQYFSHVSPSGTLPWSWMTNQGYTFTAAGENLAADFVDADDVIAAWMKSSDHRVNILKTSFKDIGVAVVDGQLNGLATTIIVQFFGAQTTTVASPTAPVKKILPATTAQPVSAPSPTAVIPVQPIASSPETIVQETAVVDLNLTFNAEPTVAGAETEVIHNQASFSVTPPSQGVIPPATIAILIISALGIYGTLLLSLLTVPILHPTPGETPVLSFI